MKSIRDIIKSNIINETNQSVDIDDTNFFVELANSKNKDGNSKIFNFTILIFVFIIGIVFVINSGIYFIKDVLGSQNDCKITPEGAVVAKMASDKEFYLFLFNASEPWTDSGIQLVSGDKVKIKASGGFFSDSRSGLYPAAQYNFKPYYDWVSMNDVNKEDTTLWYYIKRVFRVNKENKNKEDTSFVCKAANFGELIYFIGEEKYTGTIHKLNEDEKFLRNFSEFTEVKENGHLFLSVNEAKETIISEADTKLINEYIKEKNDNNIQDSTYNKVKKIIKERDTVYYNYHEYVFGGDSTVFQKFIDLSLGNSDNYKDNIGQILVAVEVQRKIDLIHWKKIWYRSVENNIVSIWNENCCMASKTLLTILYMIFAVFYAVALFIAMLFYSLWFITIPCLIVFVWYFQNKRIKLAFEKGKTMFAKRIRKS